MTREREFLLEIIRACFLNKTITAPQELDTEEFLRLVARQSLQVVVYVTLSRLKICKEIVEKLKKQVYKLIIGASTLDKDSQAVIELLTENGFKCVPLKGFNLKKLYPSPDMRYSLDFDCLIEKKRVVELKKLLNANGYKYFKTTGMHVEYHTASGSLLEFHIKVFERFLSLEFANEIFEDYKSNDGKLSYEIEYIISLAHLASHFVSGGVGIRNIIDLYLLDKKVNREILNDRLKEIGLYKFDTEFLSIASVVFDNKPATEFERRLLDIIFSSLYLGEEKNKELYRVALNYDGDLKKAKRKSFWKKIYPSYNEMKGIYPTLKKHKWLLLWFYFVRHLTVIFKRASHVKKLKQISEYNEQEVKQLKEILVGLGLENIKE